MLVVLVDSKVFPDPYCGTNLKSIPGYLAGDWLIMKSDSPVRDPWWYRVGFPQTRWGRPAIAETSAAVPPPLALPVSFRWHNRLKSVEWRIGSTQPKKLRL